MTIQRVPSTFASFSDVVAVEGPGRWIHVAGQVAMDTEAKVSGSLAEQTNVTFDHIERVLRGVGADLSHVVKITVYLTRLDDYAEFSRVRAERFGDSPPASAAVQVAGLLLGALIEIEAIAFVGASDG